MASTYEPIATLTGTGFYATGFTSIPSTYTDLRLVAHVKQSSGYSYAIRFNDNADNLYSNTQLWAPNGSVPYTQRETGQNSFNVGDTSTGDGITISTLDIMNYSDTSMFKTVLSSHNDTGNGRVYKKNALWRGTEAIHTINIFGLGNGNFTTATTFTLYGIKAA